MTTSKGPLGSLRYRACGRKLGYATDVDAKRAAAASEAKYGTKMHIYRCQFCRQRHLTSKEFSPGTRDNFRRSAKRQARGAQ